MIRTCVLSTFVMAAPIGAAAHQIIVFASVDCEAVTVEAKFSNGNAVQQAEVRVLNGESELLTTLDIGEDGTASVPLDTVDHSGGLVIEVDTGNHDNYWIVTPDDISRKCGS